MFHRLMNHLRHANPIAQLGVICLVSSACMFLGLALRAMMN